MTTIGYHASHEQFPPDELLSLVHRAGQAGFDAAMCSDHFHPWLEAQGQSGHAWCWLGSALATTTLPFGVVTCPIGRYHPAVIAQAAATLVRMHGERFWMAVGTGEALNEAITGHWPRKDVRSRRLERAVDAIRQLWRGEPVDIRGDGLVVEQARLYTTPPAPPKLFAAALTPETARRVAGWADGLITVSTGRAKQRDVIAAFRDAGGDDRPVVVQVKLAWARDEAEALRDAHAQWRANVLPAGLSQELRSPAAFAEAAAHVRPDDLRDAVRVSSDPARHADWLRQDIEDGADALYLHQVTRAQAAFVDTFGERVLPELRS